jgi:hypothetical protein
MTTAYVTRLLPQQGPPVGIRPRPRSRYEPEPQTYLGRDPREPSEQGEAARQPQGTPVVGAEREHTQFPAGDREDQLASDKSVAAQSIAEVRRHQVTAPAEPAAAAAGRSDDGSIVTRTPRDAAPAPDVRARVARQAGEVPGKPRLDRRDTRDQSLDGWSLPPRPHRHPALSAIGPDPDPHHGTATSLPAASSSATQPHPRPMMDDNPRPASLGPASRPADQPLHVARADAPPVRRQDLVRADPSAERHSRSVDPLLRQAIVNAVADPVRVETTEVSVHIDRIDIRSPSSSPPAPAEPRPRATPTSLDSYLRARSRRAGR